jgi:hypothetical protein
VSSFFEPPPPPPEPPPEPPRRPWAGARHNEIGNAVALNLILGRSDKAALWISAATVYTDGFEFEVQLQHRLDEELVDPFFMHVHRSRRRSRSAEEGLDPGLLRFGIQFSDGRKATNLPDRLRLGADPDAVPDGPVLQPGGGGGGGGRWRHDFWVWPLPPEGALAFVCEWPAAGIPETRGEIDAALIREAASEAVPLWSETEMPGGSGGWASYGSHQVVLSAEPSPEPDEPADRNG